MKKIAVLLFILMIGISGFSQMTETCWTVETPTVQIGRSFADAGKLPEIYIRSTHSRYQLTATATATETMQAVINSGRCVNLSPIKSSGTSLFLNDSSLINDVNISADLGIWGGRGLYLHDSPYSTGSFVYMYADGHGNGDFNIKGAGAFNIIGYSGGYKSFFGISNSGIVNFPLVPRSAISNYKTMVIDTATGAVAYTDNSSIPPLSVTIPIPDTVYCAIGRELNLWNDAIIPENWKGVSVVYISAVGSAKERGFRYSPTVTETNNVAVNIVDQSGTVLAGKTFKLIAVSKNNGTGTKQMLFIGNSLTEAGYIATEVRTLCVADGGITPLLLGTRGTNPNKHEGVSGKTFAWFNSSASPFYDSGIGGLNFRKYMSDNSNFGGTNTINYVFIELGINDVFGITLSQAGATTIANSAKSLINSILNSTYGYPSCKIILGLTSIMGSTKDGYALNYGAASDPEQYERNIRLLWKTFLTTFGNKAYNNNVSLAINGLMIDRKYGYATTATAVSARESTTTLEHINGVHPTVSGYYQISDAFYSVLRSLLP